MKFLPGATKPEEYVLYRWSEMFSKLTVNCKELFTWYWDVKFKVYQLGE